MRLGIKLNFLVICENSKHRWLRGSELIHVPHLQLESRIRFPMREYLKNNLQLVDHSRSIQQCSLAEAGYVGLKGADINRLL